MGKQKYGSPRPTVERDSVSLERGVSNNGKSERPSAWNKQAVSTMQALDRLVHRFTPLETRQDTRGKATHRLFTVTFQLKSRFLFGYRKENNFTYIKTVLKCCINNYLPVGVIATVEARLNLIRLLNFPFMFAFWHAVPNTSQLHPLQKRSKEMGRYYLGFFLKWTLLKYWYCLFIMKTLWVYISADQITLIFHVATHSYQFRN